MGKVALVVAVLLATGGAGVAVALEGVEVFWDRNADGERQPDEPPYPQAQVRVWKVGTPQGQPSQTDDHGVLRLEPGLWNVVFPHEEYVVTTTANAELDSSDENRRKLAIGVRGASICGTAWLDENVDGLRQEGERLISGHEISVRHPSGSGLEQKTRTADDGTYCFRDLSVDHYRLTSADRFGIDRTTWGVAHWKADDADESQVSKFDVADGTSKVFKIDTPAEDVTGVDTAFVRTNENSVEPVKITVVNPDGSTTPRDLRVGDEIKVIGTLRATGPAHDNYRGSLVLPEGLKILRTEGVPAEVREQNVVRAAFPERRAPDQEEQLVVVAVVEKAFTHRTVSLSADGHLTVNIQAIAAEERAPRKSEVRWDLVVTFVLLLAAGLAFYAWRRRKTG